MNKYILLLVFTIVSYQANSQCLVSSLVINTGYDPVAGLAIPGGANGAPAVTDPHWILTAVSPGVATAITVTPITGLVEVIPGNSADIITPSVVYAVNPGGNPGGWISCLNSDEYVTDGTGVTLYNMTLGRPFKMCSDDSITLDLYIANDNYIGSTFMDASPLLFSQPPSILAANYSVFTHFSQTVFLTAGTHTLNIDVSNYNISTPSENPTGLDIYGTISSSTGTSSLVSESNPACTSYVCGTIGPVTCDSISLPDTLPVCSTTPVTLPAILYGPDSVISIEWTPTTGLSDPGILDPTVSASASGWYYITVQSMILGVLCTATDSVYIDVTTATATYDHRDTSICSSVAGIVLKAPGGYSSYLWNTGSSASSIIAGSGIYWVSASAICALATDTFIVASIPAPIVNLGNDTSICEGNSITLNAAEPSGSQYLWGNGSTDSFISISSSGTYTLTVTQDGCSTSSSVSIGEINKPAPISLGPDTMVCDEYMLYLPALMNETNYLWSDGSKGQSIEVTETGTYWVEVVNKCGTATDTVNVTLVTCDIGLPKAFSPNGDGHNDILYVRGSGIKALNLKIFNRFGQVIFVTTDQKIGWDGTFNGQPQPVEVYAWVLNATFFDGVSKVSKGNITLLR